MNSNTGVSKPLSKIAINNNDSYPFMWKTGEPNTNIVLAHKKLDVQILRYLITSQDGSVLYDGFSIKESLNNTVVVIRNQNNQIGLAYEWRPIPENWFWACPRGFADPDDSDNLSVGKRETIEEIGNCKIVNSTKIGNLYSNTAFFENPVGLVLLDVEEVEIQTSRNEGIMDFRFYSKEDLFKMIREHEIEDTFTLSAIMRYLALEEV